MDINTFSSIPTDSLYKFLSLSGIVLILASATIPEYFRKIFLFQLFDVRSRHDIDVIEVKFLEEKIDALRNELNALKSDENTSSESRRIELSDVENAINEKIFELSKNIPITACEIKKIEYLSLRVKIITIYQKMFMFIGISFTFFGFYFWYFKLQIFLDAAIRLYACKP